MTDVATTQTATSGEWNNNNNNNNNLSSPEVYLGPVHSSCFVVSDLDLSVTRELYRELQELLYQSGYPPTEYCTNLTSRQPHNAASTTVDDDQITITALGPPSSCLTLLLGVGNECPGGGLLVLSMSWISKSKLLVTGSSGDLCSLYIHKAVVFERAGRSYITVFNPPRRVTYLINLFQFCNFTNYSDYQVETDVDCPMSGSAALSSLICDKLWTRIKMLELGIPVPETLAFTYCSYRQYDVPPSKTLRVVALDTTTGKELIRDEIRKFTDKEFVNNTDQVVVKPVGKRHHSGVGVSFHSRRDVSDICRAVTSLLTGALEGDVILVETRCQMPAAAAAASAVVVAPSAGTVAEQSLKWAAPQRDRVTCRVRAVVCRDSDASGHVTKIMSRMCVTCDVPVNSSNSLQQSLTTSFVCLGLTDSAEQQRITDLVRLHSQRMFETLSKQRISGPIRAQTDVIAVDFLLGANNSPVIQPIGIKVTDHSCLHECQLYELIMCDKHGDCVRPLVNNMLTRSQEFLMHGKQVLVVGGGGYSKRYIWQAAKDYGIEVYLMDYAAHHVSSDEVALILNYDLTDHTRDQQHAINIVQLLSDRGLRVDGCVTFWEDCGPLAAYVNALLFPGERCRGAGVAGALNAKRKSRTQEALRQNGVTSQCHLYTSNSVRIGSDADLEKATSLMSFPCVLKLEYGSSAVGVRLLADASEAQSAWRAIQRDLEPGENAHPGIGLGHGRQMLLMDFLDGTEHDVDVVIYRRRLIAAFVSDNGPTRTPRYTETAAAMPSWLPLDKQRQLIVAAHQCCVGIQLDSGVFNVEMKMTSTGPRLIEINARMAGYYLRHWIRAIYSVDMLLCSFLIACDICPVIPGTSPRSNLVGAMILPSVHRSAVNAASFQTTLRQLVKSGAVRYVALDAEMPPPDEDEYEEPFASVAVADVDRHAAKRKLVEVFSTLGLNSAEYNVEEYLVDFRDAF